MKRSAFVMILACGAAALAAWQFATADGSQDTTSLRTTAPGDATSPVPQASATVTTPVTNAGYVVHFDENGQIVEEPQAGMEDFNAALRQFISTSSEGLVEQATPVGGGVMVNLQGRFESAATATIDANGNVVVPCLTDENDVRTFTSSSAAEAAAGKE